MNFITKITAIILMLSMGVFSAVKITDDSLKNPSESKLSLEKEEKSDSESEESKLAILGNKALNIRNSIKFSLLKNSPDLKILNPEPPTSPPNS